VRTNVIRTKRLHLRVGTMESLQTDFHMWNYSCRSKDIHEAISNFYKLIFYKQEHQYIDKYLQDEKLIHLLLFNKYLVGTRDQQHEYQMIGAISMRLLQSGGYIVYLGIHHDKLQLDKTEEEIETSTQPTKKKNSIAKQSLRRAYYLGTFLICCIQKMMHIKNKKHHLAAQVSKDPVQGPLYFYKKTSST
jgi:hypothetical protein